MKQSISPSKSFKLKSLSRMSLLWTSLIIFLVSSFIALVQPVTWDVDQSIEFPHVAWWLYPTETNEHKRLDQITGTLNAIGAVPNTNNIWAVGNTGMALNSTDLGRTWTKRELLSEATEDRALKGIVRGYVQNRGGQRFSQVQILSISGEVLGRTDKNGEFLINVDKGQQTLTLESGFGLVRRLTVDVKNDYSLMSVPYLYQTNVVYDAVLYDVSSQVHLVSVRFDDSHSGWILTNQGLMYHTTDGGDHWRKHPPWLLLRSPLSYLIRKAQLGKDGLANWGVTLDGNLFTLDSSPGDGGRIIARGVTDAQFDDNGKVGLAAVLQEGLSRTTDGGDTWSGLAGTGYHFNGLYFESNVGWSVGDRGEILHSTDRGDSWNRQRSNTQSSLRAVTFLPDRKRGWAVGNSGTILGTIDGGDHWFHQTQGAEAAFLEGQYRRGLPGWYYVTLSLATILVGAAVLRRDPTRTEKKEGIADIFSSDKPLESNDPDALNLSSIALGLSRFLRNEKTLPPLTVAITGEWGTGKTSLMNLLRSDLRKYGYRSVWFNAWHHQKEEHLLASLLQNVRLQAIPQWWRFEGMAFRMRLLGLRGRRYLLPTLILLLLFSFFTGLVITSIQPSISSIIQPLLKLDLAGAFERFKQIDKANLGFLVSLSGVLAAFWKGIRAFRENPANLMASMARNLRVRDLDSQTSFRRKFAVEFGDVTRSLSPRTLIIFIDDLDRCRPQNMLEVLEAVNFLVSSGDCFILIGMARERVEGCVGLSFKDYAEELAIDEHENRPDEADSKKRRRDFAKQYLDKLVNIEVPIPQLSSEQSRRLLVAYKQQVFGTKESTLAGGFNFAKKYGIGILALALVVLVVAYGYQIGRGIVSKPAADLPTTEPSTAVMQPGQTQPAQPLSSSRERASNVGRSGASTSGVAAVVQEDQNSEVAGMRHFSEVPFPVIFWLVLPLAVVAFWTGFAVLTRKPDLVVRDSDIFEKALSIWHPVIAIKHNTPRSIKRFMNRVRYLAMRQRPQSDSSTLWERLAERVGIARRKKDAISDSGFTAIPESILVALASLHATDRDVFEKNSKAFESVASRGFYSSNEGIASTLIAAQVEHERVFGNWRSINDHRKIFLEVSSGLHVN